MEPRSPNPFRPRLTLGAALALLAAPAAAQGTIESMEGPAGRAWAGVGPETVPARLAPEDLPGPPEAWSEPEPWLDWARLLGAEAAAVEAGAAPDSRRRVRLALLAWSQGRSDDAWDHLAACTAEPAWLSAAVPHLAPGVPLELLAERTDPDAPLPMGVHLRPALPPAPIPAAEIVHGMARIPQREVLVDRLAIGTGVVSMRIALEPDGVQVDVTHLEGGPVELSATLPEPIDFQIKVEYVNWMRQETLREPLAVRVDAENPTGFLFGRFRPRILPWTETLPDGESEQLLRHGVQLRIPGGSEAPGSGDPGTNDSGRLRGFAAALRELFGWRAEVLTLDPAEAPAPWPGIVMHFGPSVSADEAEHGDDSERKFRGLISLVEHYALRPRE